MMRIDLQLFGGRGSGSGAGPGLPSGGGGGGAGGAILGTEELVTQRGAKEAEVDEVLTVTRAFRDQYGNDVVPEELQVADIANGAVMAYYDSMGNLAINRTYFNDTKMTSAYDDAVKDGFHPSRGNKTAMEATAAHEMGHRLADVATQRAISASSFSDGKIERKIVENAAKKINANGALGVAKQISGYAQKSYSECIAEAVADVYCNGSKASKASTAVVNELNKVLRRK